MDAIVKCETSGTYNPTIQSEHVYTASNAPRGYKQGDREQSYGLAQIHVPVHSVTVEQATQPLFAIDFLAKNIAKGKAGMWTCYKQLATR